MTPRDDMPTTAAGTIDPALERLLTAVAADAAWPVTPDLRAVVAARIEAPPAPDLRAGVLTRIGDDQRRGFRLRILRPLAVALVLVLAIATVAIGLGLSLPGLDLRQVEETPAAPSRLDLGSPMPLSEALGIDAPRVLVPAALPAPDEAYELRVDDQRIVSLAWRASPGDPVLAGTDTLLTLMAVPGTTQEPLIMKQAGPGTRLERIDVNGDAGWWITGAPHDIMVVRPDGDIGIIRAAVVGDTLVFSRDGTLYRIESALGKDATLGVARSLTAP